MIEKLYTLFLKYPIVYTDTRNIQPNSIFFALKGENFNGNTFAEQALTSGSAIAVVDEKEVVKNENYFLVEDVLIALQQLAAFHRKTLKTPIIAITGSNGKTTTKELVNAVLSQKYKTLATKGNLNNHIGVPLTLLSITEEHEVAIVEMGANHQGEIAQLCAIADPDYGIITNIGKAHLEGFGGLEGVKKGKGELYSYIQDKKGKLFIHGDDAVLIELAGTANRITYGTKKLYDVVGTIKTDSNSEFISLQWATRYTAATLKNSEVIKTQLVGIYNYYNILCAICVGYNFRVGHSLIDKAIRDYVPSNNRSQLYKTKSNSLILDYYNANPSSMSLAIENFAALTHSNKMVVLGDMLELGEDSVKEHQAIIELLKQKNITNVVLIGSYFTKVNNTIAAKLFENSNAAADFLKNETIKNAFILIKGSRGVKLEKVVEVL